MDIIKKLFPNYKSKAELWREISFLNGLGSHQFIQIDRDIIKIGAQVQIDDCGTPTDVLKRMLRRELSEQLEPCIEYDVMDSEGFPHKYLIGTVYVSVKK